MRRALIAAITFVAGLFYILEFVLPSERGIGKRFADASPHVGAAVMVIAAFAVGLGLIGVLRHHLKRVFLRQKDWYNSLALLVAMFAMATFKIWQKYEPPDIAQRLHDLLFHDMYNQLTIAVFSLLAFYVASAAFRAFRIRSMEAALMMATALVVMLGQIPVGATLSSALRLPVSFAEARLWIMEVINMAAQRAILFGTYIGGLAFALRILLSLDRDSLLERER